MEYLGMNYYKIHKDRLLKEDDFHKNLVNLIINNQKAKKSMEIHIGSVAGLLTDKKINHQQAKKLIDIAYDYQQQVKERTEQLLKEEL